MVGLTQEVADRVLDLMGVGCEGAEERARARLLTLITLESLRAALAGSSPKSVGCD